MNTAYRHLHLFLLEKSMSLSKQKIHIHLHLTDFVALLSKSYEVSFIPQNSILKTNFPHIFAIIKY